jgi:hypothetical protein
MALVLALQALILEPMARSLVAVAVDLILHNHLKAAVQHLDRVLADLVLMSRQ